jgi:hypothetical protein
MTNAIENAVQEIKSLAAKEIDLLAKQAAKQSEIADAEQQAGAAYLRGDDTGHLDRAARLASEARAIGFALQAARQKRHEAVADHHRAIISDLRSRGVEARGQADGIKSKTAPLLEALKKLEGVDHNPAGVAESVRFAAMADLMARQADELDRRGPDKHGHVHLDGRFTVAEIAQAVGEVPADGPAAVDVLAWLNAQKQAHLFETSEISARINWDATGITQQSYVTLLPQAIAPQPEAPAADSGPRKLSYNQLMGYDARPTYGQPAEKSA